MSNAGDGNLATGGPGPQSNLKGTIDAGTGRFAGAGGFFSLPDGAAQPFVYTYTPISHTVDSASLGLSFENGSADGTNRPETASVLLTGQGVGPVFGTSIDPATIRSPAYAPAAWPRSEAPPSSGRS